MSEQSPWGAPPPSGPTPPQQPPYQQGGAGGWSGGPPSYGVPLHQGPQGPQGPRKRTGLVLAVVAAVLLVVGAFAITLVVVGNNGDDEPTDASSSEPTTDPTATDPTEPTDEPTDSTDSPTDEPTTDPTETSAAPTADGDVVGDGYGYDLPAAGWKDVSDQGKELAGTVDTALVLGPSLDLAQSSIIVEALSAGMATSLEDLAPVWKRNLASSDNATPVDIAETSIAGERAIGVRIDDRVNNAGDPIRQIAYLVLHEGKQYSIALSYPGADDVTSKGDFETMLASWSWAS